MENLALENMVLQLALSELSREWDFLVKVEIIDPKTLLPAIKKAVDAYRATLAMGRRPPSLPAALPYVLPEVG